MRKIYHGMKRDNSLGENIHGESVHLLTKSYGFLRPKVDADEIIRPMKKTHGGLKHDSGDCESMHRLKRTHGGLKRGDNAGGMIGPLKNHRGVERHDSFAGVIHLSKETLSLQVLLQL